MKLGCNEDTLDPYFIRAWTKEYFEQAIVKMVAFGSLPLRLFSSDGFRMINGSMTKQLGVSLDRDNIQSIVVNTANHEKENLINIMRSTFVHVKLDACTRLRVNYLGVNVQYYSPAEDRSIIKTLV